MDLLKIEDKMIIKLDINICIKVSRFLILISILFSVSVTRAQNNLLNLYQENKISSFDVESIDSITFSEFVVDEEALFENMHIINPYPVGLDTLRVLILGNSFSVDATSYLQVLLDSTEIDQSRIGIYNYMIPSASFQTWIDKYKSEDDITVFNSVGKYNMNSSGKMKEILSQQWDVVILLTSSSMSYQWDTLNNTTPELLQIVKENCPNESLRIAYMLPWGHTEQTTPRELVGNVRCAKQLMKLKWINFFIPVGIAVQNARNSSLLNDTYLTRDDWHLCHGVGRYVAACAMFESLISPVFHVSCYGNNGIKPLSQTEIENKGTIIVDQNNIRLCQECAILSTYYNCNVVVNK